jgi:hypothetical protein
MNRALRFIHVKRSAFKIVVAWTPRVALGKDEVVLKVHRLEPSRRRVPTLVVRFSPTVPQFLAMGERTPLKQIPFSEIKGTRNAFENLEFVSNTAHK